MITDVPAAPATLGSAPLASLLSPDVGVVHRVDSGVTQWDHPRLAPAFAQLCDTRPVLDIAQQARPGGLAHDLAGARVSAAGEAVERYSAAHVPYSRLRVAVRAELEGPVAEPDWLDRSAARPPSHWVAGHLLRDDRPATPAWVAASRAFLADVDHDLAAMHPTSTGLACHPDPWAALAAGLLEVVERDAFMLTWLLQRAVVPLAGRFAWRTPHGGVVDFDRAIETYRLFLLPSPTGIPVVLGVAFGRRGQPAVAVGAGAHPDLGRACRRALVETQQTFQWAAHMLARGDEPPAEPDDCADFDDHVAYYLRPERLTAFEFLFESPLPTRDVDLDSPAATVTGEPLAREITSRVVGAGFDPYAVDVTSPDVRTAGLWVVRAVIDGMYPLLVGTTVRPDLPRLPIDRPVNPDPHPFP